jgi:hypothetical protein
MGFGRCRLRFWIGIEDVERGHERACVEEKVRPSDGRETLGRIGRLRSSEDRTK